ncbi:probable DNA metabolism protein [Malonomonas rubra DSM 5091]|uniref:Probable DNA metabolism protein n=1 Tax=Malonomonas rubra DSM 5091 TaxID=1122189 RepID=A0A1M6CHQ8_MALRU|nr:TIGR03915 family putative DNA repair protein [Malonomonas rubra]SHI60294.1 probable DNA metabolism protein [Malonomonas rubra DSM 5091]
MILTYDGSLCGFLCLLGRAIKERIDVSDIQRRTQPGTADLFDQEQRIHNDPEWAAKVASGLESKLGRGFMITFAQAFYSEEEGVESDLLAVTRRALREGASIMNHLAEHPVGWVHFVAQKSNRERHRLLGLLRFQQLTDGSYLARTSPRCNVVPLLGSHFAKRLGDQRWLIVDEKRKLGIWGEKRKWSVVENIAISEELTLHDNEQKVADLWRCFYHNISNPGRHNPKLRQQFMPKMYWQYLTEMQPYMP